MQEQGKHANPTQKGPAPGREWKFYFFKYTFKPLKINMSTTKAKFIS